MTNSLQGKVALVTGASSGIGRATALALAERGADVAIAARRLDRLTSLRDELVGLGVRACPVRLDVADETSCRQAVDLAVAELGGLDILVNNAGVMLLGQIEGADTEDWRRMIDTNVLGLMYMTHAGLPQLLERRGVIVQMSSTAGRAARAGTGAYNASKWAVNGFSEALRQEVNGRGVRVVVIEPGIVRTELREHITQPAAKERIEAMADAIRQLEADDVAAAVVYAVTQPDHVAVNELLVRPTDQQW